MTNGTADEILDLLDASVASAATGAAIELGLFWLLDREPLGIADVGERLGVPAARARVWLRVLERAGLIEVVAERVAPTEAARAAILATYSRATWGLLAQEARERRDALVDLQLSLLDPLPTGRTVDYVSAMAADEDRARRFTRMLFEIHQPLARRLADSLDMGGVRRLLDIGGGSGVVSVSLARRHPDLVCTVIDIASVCRAGRDVVREQGLGDRVRHVAADIRSDALPSGADVVLECDVGVYDEGLFGRVRDALRPGGRFLIVDRLARDPDEPPVDLAWALMQALSDPDHVDPDVASVERMLRATGFEGVSDRPLPGSPGAADDRFGGQTIIEGLAPPAADA